MQITSTWPFPSKWNADSTSSTRIVPLFNLPISFPIQYIDVPFGFQVHVRSQQRREGSELAAGRTVHDGRVEQLHESHGLRKLRVELPERMSSVAVLLLPVSSCRHRGKARPEKHR